MKSSLLEILACPCCGNEVLKMKASRSHGGEIVEGEIICSRCRTRFPVQDGIPVMLSPILHGEVEGDSDIAQKRAQARFHDQDGEGNSDFAVTRPHGLGQLYNYLTAYKIESSVQLLGQPIDGRMVLDVCCGNGMDAEFLARLGAHVVGLDISVNSLRGARRRSELFGFRLELVAGDAENLPFKRLAFDYGSSHDGLHHLPNPLRGIAELARVSRCGIFFVEPADAFLTRLAVKVGIAPEYEPCGNFVYRFAADEVARTFAAESLAKVRLRRALAYCPHYPLRIFTFFDKRIPMAVFKLLFAIANSLVGRMGNKLVAVGLRENTLVD